MLWPAPPFDQCDTLHVQFNTFLKRKYEKTASQGVAGFGNQGQPPAPTFGSTAATSSSADISTMRHADIGPAFALASFAHAASLNFAHTSSNLGGLDSRAGNHERKAKRVCVDINGSDPSSPSFLPSGYQSAFV